MSVVRSGVPRDPGYVRGTVYLLALLLSLFADRILVAWVGDGDVPLIPGLIVVLAMLWSAAMGATWWVLQSVSDRAVPPLGLLAGGLGAIALPVVGVIVLGHGVAADSVYALATILWYFAMPAMLQDTRVLIPRGLIRSLAIAVVFLAGAAWPFVVLQVLDPNRTAR